MTTFTSTTCCLECLRESALVESPLHRESLDSLMRPTDQSPNCLRPCLSRDHERVRDFQPDERSILLDLS